MLARLALGNVRKAYRDFAVYFVTLVFGVAIFYTFNSIEAEQQALVFEEGGGDMIDSLAALVGFVSVAVAVVLGFLVVYANRFLVRRRKREFGIYQVLGMRRAQVLGVLAIETLVVGAASLSVGLVTGVALSQLMLYVTAALFKAQVKGFAFVFSAQAALRTVAYFAVMFATSIALSSMGVARLRLVQLMNASREPERMPARNVAVSAVAFVVGVGLVAWAYMRLERHGLFYIDRQFMVTTGIVVAGTVLFFWGLCGFLLRVVALRKDVYLRGLNMFTLRQLSSRVNTSFVSISVVCMILFLAFTSTCGGFSIASALNSGLEKAAPYDITLQVNAVRPQQYDTVEPDDEAARWRAYAEEGEREGYDVAAKLARDMQGYDELVRDAAQIMLWRIPAEDGEGAAGASTPALTYGSLIDGGGYELAGVWAQSEIMLGTYVDVTCASQFNAALELQGAQPVEVPAGTYLMHASMDKIADIMGSFAAAGGVIELPGGPLAPVKAEVDRTNITTSFAGNDTGLVVVADEDLPANAVLETVVLNIMYKTPGRQGDEAFLQAFYDMPEGWLRASCSYETAQELYDQSSGLATIAAYLAIYIGLVLFLACAAILALQQLCAAADDVGRYATLRKLGAEPRAIDRALLAQIGVYFLFPLALALCHSTVALRAVADVVMIFGHMNIVRPLAITAAGVGVLYGGYFLITYWCARNVVGTSGGRVE